MELIPYEQFSKMRLEDFLPADQIRNLGPSAECALGFGGGRGYGFTALFWPDGLPGVVSELQLDMRAGQCPEEAAMKILQAVALPIFPADSENKILRCFGTPNYSDCDHGDEHFYRFLVGVDSPYIVGCHIHKTFGLNGLMLVRKDFWPEHNQ